MTILKKMPFWLKCGFVIGLLITVLINILPEKLTTPDLSPWYLKWITMPAFTLFTMLCIVFHVDFISNYFPGEGMYRQILIPVFLQTSLFIASFIAGLLIAVTGSALFKMIRKAKR